METDKELIYPFGINETQALAVERAFKSQISIIEGPPGTGKTQTILNILANIIVKGKTCAIVSNNNDAVKNVYEKMEKYNLDFFIAKFGRFEKREKFFDNIKHNELEEVVDEVALEDVLEIKANIEDLLSIKNRLASVNNEIQEIKIEQAYLEKWQAACPEVHAEYIEKYGLNQEKTLDLLAYVKYLEGKRFSIKEKWELLVKFRIFRIGFLKKVQDRESFIFSLQFTFYKKMLELKNAEKKVLEEKLRDKFYDSEVKKLQEKSLKYLYAYINRNVPSDSEKQFGFKNYQKDFEGFVKRFPIIGSSTHSLVNSVPVGYLFDYVIIDEASQQDLLPGILCLACARNLVVVGDDKQLSHIPHKSQYFLEKEYEFYDCVKYSLLDSVNNIFAEKVERTLLKEHYRCHPRIIQFCNKQFYDNQLIPMTEYKEENALVLVVTAAGNHMRNFANQREIESVKEAKEFSGFLEEEGTVGFVAPYNNQVKKAEELLPQEIVKSTIHKFQGRECDKMIFSTVLDKKQISQRNIDFVDNAELVNVAVSRAKKEFILVTGNDVFSKNNKHIAALIRYIQYYADKKQIIDSPVISAFDLLYSEYDKSLEKLEKRLRAKDSKFKSEQIVAVLLRDIMRMEEFKTLVFHKQIYLKQLVVTDKLDLSTREKSYINNRASCDFVIYYKTGKSPLAVVEVDGGYHDKPKQMERDSVKDSILCKARIPICRLRTTDSEIEEKLKMFLRKCLSNE